MPRDTRFRSRFRTTSLALAALVVAALASAAPGPATAGTTTTTRLLGPRVTVFDPSMTTAEIEAVAAGIHAHQVDDEMGPDRYSLLFLPGSYGTADDPLQIQVGYYTEVAGLGARPGDVQIHGKIEVYNRCFDDAGAPAAAGTPGAQCFALNNFWRSVSNLTLHVDAAGQDGCRAGNNFWAVSQASSMRRVDVRDGGLTLMDYCSGPSYASGGFIADSRAGTVINGSQQQWLTRNSEIGSWTNGVWNQVFSGVVGAPSEDGYPDPPYTTLPTTPVSREKPYLFVDGSGTWNVRVPRAQHGSSGISWADGPTAGRTVPLSDFFVARPTDSVATINAALARGQNLLLTPGVYDVHRSIRVQRAGTVVLGMGLATLTAQGGSTPLVLGDRPGIVVAGITVDAGDVLSPVLLQVGTPGGRHGARTSDPADPTTLSDVYFRVGGPHVGKADVALRIDSDDVLVDHTWVWRADHGVEGFDTGDGFLGDNVRWRTDTGRNGVVVNGDDVTATGLFVEHFQQHSTVWNGERGRVVFYQNELPYDPPTQADWTGPGGEPGWAAYKVGDGVEDHRLWGGGVYVYNRNNPDIVTANGYEVPQRPGVRLHHVMTKNLSGPGTIQHVVNGVGASVDGVPEPGDPDSYEDPSYVLDYP